MAQAPIFWSSKFDVYDIRQEKEDEDVLEKFMNQDWVKMALGVGDQEWTECSNDVYSAMNTDIGVPMIDKVAFLVEQNIPVLIYNGDKDYICNWMGGEMWTRKMKWRGQEDFNQAEYVEYNVGDETIGEMMQHENFTFLKFYDAGHMVPRNQPERALGMINDLLAGKFNGSPGLKKLQKEAVAPQTSNRLNILQN